MVKGLSRFAVKHGLIPVAYVLLRLYFCLIRIRTIDEEKTLRHLHAGGGVLGAFWHQRILLILAYAPRFSYLAPWVMISKSRDGDLIAAICSLVKLRPVRGSTSHGGRRALVEMVAALAAHPIAVHAVDGPQGPRGVIKAGLVRISQLSGVPVVPIYCSVDRAWVLDSWDRFLVPKPFSTIVIHWDEPIPLPETPDETAFENCRLAIENRMRAGQQADDRTAGWREPLF